MIIPIRCFSCNKVVGDKWEPYLLLLLEGKSDAEAFKELDLKRYCCKRMLLGHVDFIENLLMFNPHEKRSPYEPDTGATVG